MKVDTRYNYPIWHDPAISEPHQNERYAPGSVEVHIGQTPGRGMMSSPGAKALSRKLVGLFKETRKNEPPEGRGVRTTYLEPGETLRLPGGVSISHFQGNPPYGSSYYDSTSAYSHKNQLKKWINQLRSSPRPHTSVIFTGPQAHWSQGWPAAAWQPVRWHPMAWPPQPAWPPAWQGEGHRADMPSS